MRILDLFCGAGGAAWGYHLAFLDAEIVGVDIHPQPDYPFTFIQADALTFDTTGFDLIHASPPCQALTTMSNRHRGKGGLADSHLNLIPATQRKLIMSGIPWVIENVVGAASWMLNPIKLSGGNFGLGVDRDRLFDSSFPLTAPRRVKHPNPLGIYGKLDGRRIWTRKDGTEQRAARTIEQARVAMGIDWMQWDQLKEAIPPAYTKFIGDQLAVQLAAAVVG